jgi:hypothetical protein
MKILLLFLILLTLLLAGILVFKFAWKKPSGIRSVLIKLSVTGFTLLIMFIIFEIVFQYIYVQSANFSFTLSSRKWLEKYWHPVNAFGYRDVDHDHGAGKKVLFVVGDSFVAGYGLEDYRMRFSNILAEKLGGRWDVVNIARNGWDTMKAYDAIRAYPHEPDMILLSYHMNDIAGAAMQAGIRLPFQTRPPSRFVRLFVDRSYFVNFLYWRYFRYSAMDRTVKTYFHYLGQAYFNPAAWRIHQGTLTDLVDYTKERNIPLAVLVFPDLSDIGKTKKFTSKVVDLMRDRHIKVIDLAEILEGRDAETLVVSKIDAHPSPLLHREIGERLYQELGACLE